MQTLGQFEKRVLTAFAVAMLVVAALAALSWKIVADAAEATRLVAHTYEVLNILARVRANTLSIELSTQGFRISGDETKLADRDTAIAEREMQLEQLKRLTTDNPWAQALWLQLRQVVDQRLAIAREIEQIRKTQGSEAATAFVGQAPLRETRTRIYQILLRMDDSERELLSLHQNEQRGTRLRMFLSATLASVALFALLLATYLQIRRQFNQLTASRQTIAEREEDLSITLRSIGDAVIATDIDRRITRMNPVAELLTGWRFSEAKGRLIEEVFKLKDELSGLTLASPVTTVLESGEGCELANHTCLVTRDGAWLPIADSAAPIRDSRGKVRGVVIVFHDETEPRLAKKAIREKNLLLEQRIDERTRQLRESESHLQEVINNVPALIAYVNRQQQYVYVNHQYRERFAPGKSDITGQAVRDILGDERYRIAAPLIERVLAGEFQSYDWQPFPGVWQLINYAPKYDAHGEVIGYYVLGTDITERYKAEQALRDSEQRLARVLEGAEQGYWDWNLETNQFTVSGRWESMLGYAPGEMNVEPANWPTLVHPEDFPLAVASIERHLQGETARHEVEIRCKTKEGSWRWIRTSGRIVERAENGSPRIMSGTHTDITQRKSFEQAQREAMVVFENSYESIMVVNADGLITKVNPSFTRITGYPAEAVIGQPPKLLASGQHDPAFYQAFWEALLQNDFWQGEIWNRRKNGELFAALQSISVVRDNQGRVAHYVSVFADITPLKNHEMALDRAANYDALTALPNRRLLSDRLAQSIARSSRNGRLSAICFLDLDGFKEINEHHGYDKGNQLLLAVSKNLQQVLRAYDTLARPGGDEFVVIFSDIASTEECSQVLDRLLQAVRKPILVDGSSFSISASIGVSLYPADNVDPDILLRHADQAMYQAKQAGKNRYQLFDLESDRTAQKHRAFLENLQRALVCKEFVLFYQPKVDLVSGELIGVEALARWQHPELGLLPPGEFLPRLNGSELECAFGEWVIESALAQIESWMDIDLDIKVSVNISAKHLLQAGFVGQLAQALTRHPRVPAQKLELEILETAALGDIALAVEVLNLCMALGVRFSLDDFGTGYSSLTYLRKLPVDTLKIDQSFVREMLNSRDDLGIVQGVIQLANVFNRQVIAEGVETLDHGTRLREMGCRFAQGYGIAKPMPAAQLPAWHISWRSNELWKKL